jgi:hypothetical protein
MNWSGCGPELRDASSSELLCCGGRTAGCLVFDWESRACNLRGEITLVGQVWRGLPQVFSKCFAYGRNRSLRLSPLFINESLVSSQLVYIF